MNKNRYGKLAYEAFCLKLISQKDEDDYIDFFSFLKKNDNEFYSWDELPKNFQNVWIEVGVQIERLTLSEQN